MRFIKNYFGVGILIIGLTSSSSFAQDVAVKEILVVDEVNTGLPSQVFRETHAGESLRVGYAANGRLADESIKCEAGERFTAQTPMIGYTQISYNTDRCSENVKIVLAAPNLRLALVELASAYEAKGDYAKASLIYNDVVARLDFSVRDTSGASVKAQFAEKAYINLEKALGQTGLYTHAPTGWPVLTQGGAAAIGELQASKGLAVTGQLDSLAYQALTTNRMNEYIKEAYGKIAANR